MKKLFLIASVLTIFFTGGCGVVSLGSIGRACDGFYESKLIGRWELHREEGKAADATITVTRAGYNIYKVSLVDGRGEVAQYSAMLMKAGGFNIIETMPSGKLELEGKKISQLMLVQTMPLYNYFILDSISEDKIMLRAMQPEKVKAFIKDSGAEYVIKNETSEQIILTGDMVNVRDFIVKAAADKELWLPFSLTEPERHAACYDPRAVAIAFSRSTVFEEYLNKKMKASADAEESGNMNLVESIRREVEQMQEELHKIAFNGKSAGAIFDLAAKQVEEVKKCQSVNELVSKWDEEADVDELPDVTMELAAIFEPSRQALDAIKALPAKPLSEKE